MKNWITKANSHLRNEVIMFEKMTFQNQEEKDDFEKYRRLKGDDLYYQIYRILLEKTDRVRYVTVKLFNIRKKTFSVFLWQCRRKRIESFFQCSEMII